MIFEEIRHIRSGRRELRSFGFLIGGALVCFGLFLSWKDRPAYPGVLSGGAALLAVAAAAPGLLLPLQKVWMTLAIVLGRVMSRVVLTAGFFLVLTPVGLLARASGKRFLDLRLDRSASSYWRRRDRNYPKKEDYLKQF